MWLKALLNSLLIYGMVLAFVFPCAWLVSVMLMRTFLPGRRAMMVLLVSALATPVYVQAGAWNSMFGQFGWWTLTQVGAVQNGWGGPLAVGFIQAAYVFPWVVLTLCHGLAYMDQYAEENAWLETGVLSTLVRVSLPLMIPHIALATVLALCLLSTDMTVTNLYRVDTITERFYQQASAGELNWTASVMPVVQGMVLITLVWGLYRFLSRYLKLPTRSSRVDERKRNREIRFTIRRSHMGVWGTLAWSVVAFWIVVPFLNLLWNAGWTARVMPEQNRVIGSWQWTTFFNTLWQTPIEFQAEFLWSIYLGICAATFWLLFALVLSFAWQRKNSIGRIGAALLFLLVFIPGPMSGLVTIYLWNRNWPAVMGWLYDHTLVGPIFALGVRMLPVAILGVVLLRARLSLAAQEIALLDGITNQRLWLSWYAKNFSSLLGVWFLLFLLSVADLSAVLLVLPPGVTPISARVFELLHYGVRYQESGVCLVISAFSVIGAGGIYFLSVRPMLRQQIIDRDLR